MTQHSLKLVSSMATRELLAALVARYEADTGQRVTTEAAGGVDVAKRVDAGEMVDVVVLASNAIDKLIADGRLVGDRVDIVRSGIAIAVRAVAQQPPIDTEADIKALVLASPSLSYSTGPSGVYLEKLFARWGILEQIRARIVVPPPGMAVGALVANGTAALGFQQLSELMNLEGIKVVGPLPDAIQSLTVFSGAVSASSAAPDAARALLAYLASPLVAAMKHQYGMTAAG
jgi:molybdate transport system substrate-binding protein